MALVLLTDGKWNRVNSDDPLRKVAETDDIFEFALDFTDRLPKEYNTVDVAVSKTGETGELEVNGTVVSLPVIKPIKPTKKDKENGDIELLQDKVHVFFKMKGNGPFSLKCAVHNVIGIPTLPYGKDGEDFRVCIMKLKEAFEKGKKITVVGKYVNYYSNRQFERILYVDSLNVEKSSFVSDMTDGQFERFMELCERHHITPLEIFKKEVFVSFLADDYLIKLIAVFCLSPNSRDEMCHIMILSAPGEGKDYMVDKLIQPMVPCGKVTSDVTVSAPALGGAMSKDDLTSVAPGVLQKYHRERLACSEIQTWSEDKWSMLMGVMAEGRMIQAKGQVQDKSSMATENLIFLGNIPNNWKSDMEHIKKLDSVFGGKNKQYYKQMLSRISLIFADVSLLENPDPKRKAEIIADNIDKNSATKEDEIFENDDIIKAFCARADLDNKQKSDAIRKRKIELLKRAGRTEKEIVKIMKQDIYQKFLGAYFKYVSLMDIRVKPIWDVVDRTLSALSKQGDFTHLLCNEAGHLDARKYIEFLNLCKSFARIHGHHQIEHSDISEAELLYKKSLSTLVNDFGLALLDPNGLDVVELDILKFVLDNGGVTMDEIVRHVDITADKKFMDTYMQNIAEYLVESDDGRYIVNRPNLSEGLRKELNVDASDTISEVEPGSEANRKKMSDDEFSSRLAQVDMGDV